MSNDMHPDLKWLAENVSQWGASVGGYDRIIKYHGDVDYCQSAGCDSRGRFNGFQSFNETQWLQDRRDLGLVMTEAEEEMVVEERAKGLEGMATLSGVDEYAKQPYSKYFRDVRHLDFIDVYRVVDLFECEKHGHPISHAAKKLLLTGVRTGGKDVETEVREAIDSLSRWIEMREEDKASALRAGELGE